MRFVVFWFISCTLLFASLSRADVVTTTFNAGTYTITSSIDYGSVAAGSDVYPEMVIINTGVDDLYIGAIGDTNPVAAPFSLASNNCSNTLLKPNNRCAVSVKYAPTVADVGTGPFVDSFNVEFPELAPYTVNLTADTTADVNEADIFLDYSSYYFGSVDLSNDTIKTFPLNFENIILGKRIHQYIRNRGDVDLNLVSISLAGPDAALFNYSTTCDVVVPVGPGESCEIVLKFTPSFEGYKTATITIVSDDVDEGTLEFVIYGYVVGEKDGVPGYVEDAGLNNGDSNYDGIADKLQANVASFPSANGAYVSLLSESVGTTTLSLFDVTVLDQTAFVTPEQSDAIFSYGIFNFSVESAYSAEAKKWVATVGILLPLDYDISSFYMYGPTPTDSSKHWYEFLVDPKTGFGASILGTAIIDSQNGASYKLVQLVIEDGGLGDSDLQLNGVVKIQGGVTTVTPSTDEGALKLYFIFLVVLILGFRALIIRRA